MLSQSGKEEKVSNNLTGNLKTNGTQIKSNKI